MQYWQQLYIAKNNTGMQRPEELATGLIPSQSAKSAALARAVDNPRKRMGRSV